jgi:hypothetical protein
MRFAKTSWIASGLCVRFSGAACPGAVRFCLPRRKKLSLYQ